VPGARLTVVRLPLWRLCACLDLLGLRRRPARPVGRAPLATYERAACGPRRPPLLLQLLQVLLRRHRRRRGGTRREREGGRARGDYHRPRQLANMRKNGEAERPLDAFASAESGECSVARAGFSTNQRVTRLASSSQRASCQPSKQRRCDAVPEVRPSSAPPTWQPAADVSAPCTWVTCAESEAISSTKLGHGPQPPRMRSLPCLNRAARTSEPGTARATHSLPPTCSVRHGLRGAPALSKLARGIVRRQHARAAVPCAVATVEAPATAWAREQPRKYGELTVGAHLARLCTARTHAPPPHPSWPLLRRRS